MCIRDRRLVEEAEADPVPEAYRGLADAMARRWIIGTPKQASARLQALADEYDVDEVMLHPVAGALSGTAVDAAPAREDTLRLLAEQLND